MQLMANHSLEANGTLTLDGVETRHFERFWTVSLRAFGLVVFGMFAGHSVILKFEKNRQKNHIQPEPLSSSMDVASFHACKSICKPNLSITLRPSG